ncbi:MAG: CD1845 family protein [Acutalibacteraceae bacterium]|nr:CD1845 family protein [Acutalibacteraceae bacterium]
MKMVKILLAPIRIFLTVTISVFKFLLSFSSTILAIIAFVVLMVGIFFFVDGEKTDGIYALVLAWIISPWGLPMIATWLLSRLIIFRDWLKS